MSYRGRGPATSGPRLGGLGSVLAPAGFRVAGAVPRVVHPSWRWARPDTSSWCWGFAPWVEVAFRPVSRADRRSPPRSFVRARTSPRCTRRPDSRVDCAAGAGAGPVLPPLVVSAASVGGRWRPPDCRGGLAPLAPHSSGPPRRAWCSAGRDPLVRRARTAIRVCDSEPRRDSAHPGLPRPTARLPTSASMLRGLSSTSTARCLRSPGAVALAGRLEGRRTRAGRQRPGVGCRERSGRSAAQPALALIPGQVTRPGHRRLVNHVLASEVDLACRIGWGDSARGKVRPAPRRLKSAGALVLRTRGGLAPPWWRPSGVRELAPRSLPRGGESPS